MKNTVYLFLLIFIISSCQQNENFQIVEGSVGNNPWAFKSFYGINDSLVNVLKDSFEIILNSNPTDAYIKEDIKAYTYLKDNDLLHKPCKLFTVGEERMRVYLNEKDFATIEKLIWVPKNEEEEIKHTYIKMKVAFVKNGADGIDDIYECKEILGHEYRAIEEDSLEMETEILIAPKTMPFEFDFEGVTLNGVLNIPEQDVPKGLVLIVHGSGQTNAIEQQWYKDVRETLVKSGYATYMWDKMGCGKSGGTFDYNQAVENSALEVIAAINALKQQQIAGAEDIGLWGISRAGWINPIVINQYKDIKFWISVSGVDDKENFNYLFEENLRINGYAEDRIRLLLDELKEGVRLGYTGESFERYMATTENIRKDEFWIRFNNGTLVTEEGYYAYQKKMMTQEWDEASGLMVYVENFDNILSTIKCPVLALFGEKDKHVDWKKTKAYYKETLSGNTDLTIESFADCNHNMYKAKTGGFYEFEDDKLPWDRCDGFLDTMMHWLEQME